MMRLASRLEHIEPFYVMECAKAAGEIARSPEVRAKLFQQGWQAVGSSSEGLANRMRADTAAMGRVIREQAIRAE